MVWNGFLSVFCYGEFVQNRIPKFFLLRKWFGPEFWGFFSSKIGSEQNSEVFLIQTWFGMEFRGFFSSKKWFGMEFRVFYLPWNRRNSDGNAVCYVLICIPRNIFFVQKWQPLLAGVRPGGPPPPPHPSLVYTVIFHKGGFIWYQNIGKVWKFFDIGPCDICTYPTFSHFNVGSYLMLGPFDV